MATNDTVEEIRSRLKAFFYQGDLSKEQLQRMIELETSLGNAITPNLKQPGTRLRDTSPAPIKNDSEGIIPIPGLATNAIFPVKNRTSGPGYKCIAPYEPTVHATDPWGFIE